MARRIKRVAVAGAGVMGSGIAAHLAGVGLETVLLDIVPPDLDEAERDNRGARNRFASSALKKASKSKPPTFFDAADAERIEVGNFDDDLAKIADCDWVIEVVTENLEIKRKLFAKIDQYRRPGTLITSNTSGLSIAEMVEGRSEDFKQHFFVTHFFNPVRYMRLLELVAGEDTDREAFYEVARFGGDVLGKGVVFGKDTPNFIANRIGTFGMFYTLHSMLQGEGYSVEEVDAVFGPVMGRPKSAVFRTADIVGLDTLAHVGRNCLESLTNDPRRDVFETPPFLREMIERGWLGQKSKAGFYKKVGKDIHALDLRSMEYRPREKVRAASIGAVRGVEEVGQRIKTLVSRSDDKLAQLAWEATAHTLCYSAQCLDEIADDVVNVDNALKWGFNWQLGPFATWDAIGVADSVERMQREGIEVPSRVTEMLERGISSFYGGSATQPTYYDFTQQSYRDVPLDSRQIRIAALKEGDKVVKRNVGATLYDIGDGVLLLEFHTKMNAVDDQIIAMMHQSIDLAEQEGWQGIVVGNEHKDAFSAGANLFAFLVGINQQQWDKIEHMIDGFQRATYRMRYSDIPVIAATAGLALGGGAEIAMGADAVRAHAETYIGLVEVGVGLVPAGGGMLSLLERVSAQWPDDPSFDVMPFLREVLMNVAMAKVAVGAEDAKRLRMFRASDGITLNRDLLLHDAKQTVLGMSRAGYRAPKPMAFRLPGPSGAATFRWFAETMRQGKQITDHDYTIVGKLAWILCGGETSPRVKVSQQHILDLEREAFMSLCGEPKTKARIEHMLKNKKPLRN